MSYIILRYFRVWCHTDRKPQRNLESSKNAIRAMLKLNSVDSAESHFEDLKIMTVHGLYICLLL